MTSSTTLSDTSRSRALRCVRCDSRDVHRDRGGFAALAGFVHRKRYRCGECGARFWRRAEPSPIPVKTELQTSGLLDWPETQNADVAADERTGGTAAPVADLSALDAELARLRAAATRRRMPFGEN